MNYSISVIIPVYNAKDYIEDCVNSILKQDKKDFEMILVDDGSTDGSGEICDSIAKDAGAVCKVFHTENQGAAAARNYGIQKAEGEYIAFVDSDDVVTEDYLSYLYGIAKKQDADIAVCGFKKVYPEQNKKADDGKKFKENTVQSADDLELSADGGNGKESSNTVCVEERENQKVKTDIGETDVSQENPDYISGVKEYPGTDALENLLYQKNFMSVPWGMISKKKLWETVSFPEGTKAEDMGTIYRLFAESRMTVYGEKICYFYMQRAGNTMFSTSEERNRDYFQHSREMVKFIKENNPALMPAARSRHFSACFQILSETSEKGSDVKLLGKIYADVKRIRKYVLKDKNARTINRGAALLSYISVGFLHFVLRGYYRMQRGKLK